MSPTLYLCTINEQFFSQTNCSKITWYQTIIDTELTKLHASGIKSLLSSMTTHARV